MDCSQKGSKKDFTLLEVLEIRPGAKLTEIFLFFQALDEKELIFELVKDICNDLDIKWLCHKILQNVSILTNADRCSLFLVQGEREGERILVSTLFDVCAHSTPEQMIEKEEIQVPWGIGIVGFVAKTGESVNIPDAYMVGIFPSAF